MCDYYLIMIITIIDTIVNASAGHQPISEAMYPFSTKPGNSLGIRYFQRNLIRNSQRRARPITTASPMIVLIITSISE